MKLYQQFHYDEARYVYISEHLDWKLKRDVSQISSDIYPIDMTCTVNKIVGPTNYLLECVDCSWTNK